MGGHAGSTAAPAARWRKCRRGIFMTFASEGPRIAGRPAQLPAGRFVVLEAIAPDGKSRSGRWRQGRPDYAVLKEQPRHRLGQVPFTLKVDIASPPWLVRVVPEAAVAPSAGMRP